MKRFLTFLFLLVVFFSRHNHTIALEPPREHISLYHVNIRIETAGTVHIQEVIEYDFGGDERHGIFRNIPYTFTNESGKKYAMDLTDFAVLDAGGSSYTFEKTNVDEAIQLKIGDPDKTITGRHTYMIGYRAGGALAYFPGHDELYWNAIGTDWPVDIDEAVVYITLPKAIAKEDFHVTCFTGSTGSKDAYCESTVLDDFSVEVKVSRPLGPYQGLTIVVGFPKGIVAVLEPREVVPFFDTFWGKVTIVGIALAVLLWYIVLPMVIIRKWWTGGRDPKPAMGQVAAWFSPPHTKKRRALTPAETGTLIDERADLRDIYATIVDLARRGYLKIIETKKDQFRLEKTKEWHSDAQIRPFERELLSGIFKKSDQVTIESLDLSGTLETVNKLLYETLVHDGFFPHNPHVTRGKYTLLAVLAGITFNPILLVVSAFFGFHMPRKTLFGSEQAAIARSLKSFLTSQDKQLAFQAKNQMMFEKLLPFAVAFGVEEIWAKRFEDINLRQPDWYVSSHSGHFYSASFSRSLGSGLSASFHKSIRMHSTTGRSSGFSGGGSSGGGGGGSW